MLGDFREGVHKGELTKDELKLDPNPKKEIYGYQFGQYATISDAPIGFLGIKKNPVTGEDYSACYNLDAEQTLLIT